jgi:hypothetical protein
MEFVEFPTVLPYGLTDSFLVFYLFLLVSSIRGWFI